MALIGASVRDREGLVHLRLDRAVTVLYGMNAAGKTSLLRSLEALFDESSPREDRHWWFQPALYVSTGDGMPTSPNPPEVLAGAFAEAFARRCPVLAQNVDPEAVGRELAHGGCLRFAHAHDLEAMPAYTDENSPTLALLRRQLDAFLAEAEGDESRTRLLSDLLDGERVDGREQEAELLQNFQPTLPGRPRDGSDWLPYNVNFATVRGVRLDWQLTRDYGDSEDDVDQLTQGALARDSFFAPSAETDVGGLPAPALAAHGFTTPDVVDYLEMKALELGERATRAGKLLLSEFPALRLAMLPLPSWLHGRACRWEAFDELTDRWIPVDELSSAYGRVARLAVGQAVAGLEAAPPKRTNSRRADLTEMARRGRERHRSTAHLIPVGSLLILDEPERGLHTLAQRRMAQSLPSLADRTVVASHSAAFLDLHEHAYHVRRSATGISLTELRPVCRSGLERTWAAELGMTVTELVQLVRTIVLVEGRHDLDVLGGLVGGDLAAARARLLALHGTRDLVHVAESRWLFEFTEARILVVLDALQAEPATRELMRLEEAVRSGRDRPAAIARFRRWADSRGSSGRALASLVEAAADHGVLERIRVFGLARKDILEYLPVEQFVPGAASWDQLFQGYAREARERNQPVNGADYKAWLRRLGAPLHREGIQRAVNAVVAEPDLLPNVSAREMAALVDAVNASSMGIGTA